MSGKKGQFWDREYRDPTHLQLSREPSEDLKKFTRWLMRRFGEEVLGRRVRVLDLGCGNGRNITYLSKTFGCSGIGIDSSAEAIRQAISSSVGLPIDFLTKSISGVLPVESDSVDIVLDMMTSHTLHKEERDKLLTETVRVLRPEGHLFFKSFLRDKDAHAERLLRQHPTGEEGSYIHPKFHVYEHVWTESEVVGFFEHYFEVCKIQKSHKHLLYGKAFKRRTVSAYLRRL